VVGVVRILHDAPFQDALHRTSVEDLKDPPGDSELPHSSPVVCNSSDVVVSI